MTINYGIDADHAAWHLRAALNVAALACRSAADNGLVAAYNSLLSRQKEELSQINNLIEQDYRHRFGETWREEHDRYMTHLYNFFSMPAAKPGFCRAADDLAPQAAGLGPGDLPSFATDGLPKLEAPFLALYEQVRDRKNAIAAWDARYAARRAPPPSLPYGDLHSLLD